MFRKIRIVLASIFFCLACLLFLDFTGVLHNYLSWVAKIQFFPAVLALNAGVIVFLILLTLLFGRVYCSVICPLGIMQDIISAVNGKIKKKNKFRFKYHKAVNALRYTFLVIFVIIVGLGFTSITSGLTSVAAFVEPYSTFGRIISNIFSPIYLGINNLCAFVAEKAGSYAFYHKDILFKGFGALALSLLSLIVVGIFAWKGGRFWCNSICPVGTILGFLSRFSLFAPVINTEKCRNCGLCGKHCKSSCIDMVNHKIDYSRCVVCMDCLETCNEGAIQYKFRFSKFSKGTDRRNFLVGLGGIATVAALQKLSTGTALAQDMKVDGGLAEVLPKQNPSKVVSLKPAGSISLKNFTDKCIACSLCINNCPNDVLKPRLSIDGFLQAEMSFNDGYCRPECTRCSELCPTGAIRPITVEEKTAIHIGLAKVDYSLCLASTGKEHCGHCAHSCPAGAITMVNKIPVVDEQRCIGCGACEYLCPTRPVSAIKVEAYTNHHVN